MVDSPGSIRRRLSTDSPTLLSWLVLLVLLVLNIAVDPHFFSAFSLSTFFTDAVPLVLVAIGQFVVILSGGIDLSVGSTISIANTFVAVYMSQKLGSIVEITIAVILLGTIAGMINGIIIYYGRIQPILVTLATMSIYGGVAVLILPSPGGVVPVVLTSVLTGSVVGVPTAVIILALLSGLWWWAHRTRFLLHLISIGSDESAAQMNGVRVGLVKIAAYSVSGLFAALSGLYMAAQTTSGDPNIGGPLLLLSIAAVVIGGVRLSGGRGSLLGVISGAFILSILGSIMYLAGVSSYYQDLFQGLILLVAVGISSYQGLRNRYTRAYA